MASRSKKQEKTLTVGKIFRDGLLDQNPIFVQLLGMCPTLAVTTSVANAIGMGLAATAVLICSNLFISLLRKFIPKQVRIAAYIVIISGFVTAVELLMRAYFYSLYQALGIYLPLITTNCAVLGSALLNLILKSDIIPQNFSVAGITPAPKISRADFFDYGGQNSSVCLKFTCKHIRLLRGHSFG